MNHFTDHKHYLRVVAQCNNNENSKTNTKNLKLYTTDLQNPVLKKYGFDSASFTAGAAGAVREILRAIQSEEFIEHCKG